MSSSDRSDSSDEEMQVKASSRSNSSDSDASSKKRTSRPSKADSEDTSDSDSDSGKPSPKKANKKRTVNKRKRGSSASSDDGRVDDSLFVDAEDKARWKGLSELEKEQEIFERMEARENQRTRAEIAQQLEAKKAEKDKKSRKKRKVESESDTKSPPKGVPSSDSDSDMNAEFHKPSDISRKHKEKNAMAELKQKRKEIEKKNAKNAALSIDAVFGAQSSGSSSSSSSSPSSRSSSSSRDSSPENRNAEEVKVVKKQVETLDELKRARLSRFKLAKIIHAPFFTDTVKGCFVRIGTGPMSGSSSNYKLWQILEVEETPKVYDLEDKRTNKGLRCRHGKLERVFRAAFVSNSEFSYIEFDEWREATQQNGTLPTMDFIEKKEIDIREALNHKYSDEEVDLLIQEKSRFEKVPKNFAMRKAELAKKKLLAQQKGNLREADEIQREIDEIERQADNLDKKRSHDISAIAFINYRNRTQNKNEFLSGRVKMEATSQDDPFTRKKGGMKIVSGSKSKTDGTISASASQSDLTSAGNETKRDEQSKPPAVVKEKRKSTNMSDLHNVASFNLNFDIDIDKLINAKPLRDDHGEGTSLPPPMPSYSAPIETKARGLSLADYRRRKEQASAAGAH
ncbi:unnamed protein product [Caenorhabditis bovis]|uniref:Plus3 domain-containing protein n=1 Tax=Caenorhabditis bovis TaxID=2654633 RepID=A0A8S1EBZ9_9PELO|nr:unnamed protein product [Caenorhabditis bovis]